MASSINHHNVYYSSGKDLPNKKQHKNINHRPNIRRICPLQEGHVVCLVGQKRHYPLGDHRQASSTELLLLVVWQWCGAKDSWFQTERAKKFIPSTATSTWPNSTASMQPSRLRDPSRRTTSSSIMTMPKHMLKHGWSIQSKTKAGICSHAHHTLLLKHPWITTLIAR